MGGKQSKSNEDTDTKHGDDWGWRAVQRGTDRANILHTSSSRKAMGKTYN